VLDRELHLLISRGASGAQDAALLTTACLEADRAELVDPSWITSILKRQRFDGAWEGEPFAATPNRGTALTWYSTATLTTVLCYDALSRFAAAAPGSWPHGPGPAARERTTPAVA
jgi:hypothetical protein